MKKIFPLLLLLLQVFTISQAQNPKLVDLEGKVVEKKTNQPLEFATVTLLSIKDEGIIAGGITDQNGEFSITAPVGEYHIKVDFISFNVYLQKNIKLLSAMRLPTIVMEEDAQQLESVKITAEKSSIEYKLDKKVFNVGSDIASKGGSATNILDNVPSVSVNAEGTISLRGNSNVRVLINGKPSVLTVNNGLEQLSAESIEKVEVITNPSARYEAAGTAGIINIVLKKNKRQGFGAAVQASTGFPANHGLNLNMNYKTEKLNVFSNIGYKNFLFLGERSISQSNLYESQVVNALNTEVDIERKRNVYNLYLGGDYYLDDKNTLTMSYYYNHRINNIDSEYTYTYFEGQSVVENITQRIEAYEEPQIFHQMELNYEKRFEKKGKKLTANVQYDFWDDDENEIIAERQILPAGMGGVSNTVSRDIESSNELLFQTDLQLPFAEKSMFETGLKGEVRTISSDYKVWFDDVLSDRFNNVLQYDERIFGVYAQYNKGGKQLQYQLGLRVEHSDTKSDDRTGQFRNAKTYTNIFPSAHLTYGIDESKKVQLGYSRRITRPQFWQLNPFGGLSDNRNIFVGNPDINPMYTDAFELGVLRIWKAITFNPSLYFQHSSQFFEFITTRNTDDILLTMPVNLGVENRYGMELTASLNPYPWWTLATEFNYYAYDQEGSYSDVSYLVKDKAWSAGLNSKMKFENNMGIQVSFGYQGQKQSGQMLNKAQYRLDLAINRDFLDDKASLSLNVRNILDSRIDRRFIQDEGYVLDYASKNSGRRITATFSYRFNRKKGDRDRLPG